MFCLRPARPQDAAAVAGVHVRSWQGGYRGLLPDRYLDGLRPEDRIGRFDFGATDPGLPSTIVAVDEGLIRGFATTGPSRDRDVPDGGEILALYVDPPAWGQGVGRRLMTAARARLSHRGFVEAILWVLVGNQRAERFYRADGWKPEDRRRTETIWGVPAHEERYRRDLA